MADGGAIVVVAIDGPAGSGKSTVARRLADEVGLEYLDTGAMYRAATLAVLRAGVEPGDEPAVAEVTRRVDIELRSDGTIHVDGVDSTAAIRSRSVLPPGSVCIARACAGPPGPVPEAGREVSAARS